MNLYFQGSGSGPPVAISGPKFSRRQDTGAVLQGSVLGPALLNSTHEWMMEQSPPSASSQVTQNGQEWLIHQRIVPPFRDPATLRNRQRGISWIFTSEKSYKLERNNVGTSTCWRLSVLKEVFWSFAEEDFGVLVNNKLSRYLQCALGPMAPWTPLGRALPGGQGRDYSCLLSTGKARTGCAQR